MTAYQVDWVDAFSDRPFGGNGCAVVHGAADLPDATCMAFTRETSLVECTFLGPSEVADAHVRYFLASGEIPFAGHPTVASAASLYRRGIIGMGRSVLETGAGLVPIDISEKEGVISVEMTQIAPTFGAQVPADLVARVVGLTPEDIIAPPQFCSTGLPFCITLLRDRAAIMRARLDVDALAELASVSGARGTDMMEPYLITLDPVDPGGRTFGRLLMAPPSPPEDPFTGSATGAAAAYLWEYGLIDTPCWQAHQGHGLGRPGAADVEVLGAPGAITGVRVAGAAHILMSGTLHL
ncbi:PhzF family phenazine biosynthesis protein [Roseobacteraceae bacterium S113]